MRLLQVVALVAMAVLAGCAAPKIPYDRAASQVKTIGVLTPSMPGDATVVLASSVTHSFGLVGALVEAGIQASRESQFKTVLEQQKFVAQDSFLPPLTSALMSRGYEVALVQTARNGTDYLERYPTHAAPKVDAYLDVIVVRYGYIAAGMGSSTPYRPFFAMKARLVNAKGAVLMEDQFVYNYVGPGQPQFITIAPDPAHRFTDMEALVRDAPLAVKGLEVAAQRSADTLGKMLQ